MGLLKNIIGNAISDGISKGVGAAVGKAVEKAVAPAAERMANKGAEAIDAATSELDKSISETKAAYNETSSAVNEAAKSAGGFAGLESALEGLASRAETFATAMSASMKVCPNCEEPSPADKTFCPHCGTKLPEKTLGQLYTCEKCGAANTPGTKYCSKCGAILPAAQEEINAQKENDAKTLEQMAQLLPQFPRWTVGGKDFRLEPNGEQNGYPVYMLFLTGGYKELEAYEQLLLNEGFKQTVSEYYKTIDGVCRTFSAIDAVDDNTVSVGFYVSTYDKDLEKKPVPDPLADLKGAAKEAAKGMFKKFLG